MTDDKTITINFSVQPGQEIDAGKMFENAMRRGQIEARLERLTKHRKYLNKVTNEIDHLRWSIIKEEFKLNEELKNLMEAK